ncbi:MAG: dihydropteroate synthase [Phycisphaerales bacterium]|nr:dihydropteroate synthase [Phycisphaerales bacterium]
MKSSDLESWLRSPNRPVVVMGILNITPDSFSDGGRHLDPASAVAAAEEMARHGAALIDLGAESTRPGATPVPAEEQIRRLAPVLDLLSSRLPNVVLSVDTTDAKVAEFALRHGVRFVNDISAGRHDPRMFPLIAEYQAAVCLMHMQGTPLTMQVNPVYGDVVAEVKEFLRTRVIEAEKSGIPPHRIVIDPGIGFGKTLEHNLALLKHLGEFRALGRPILIGTSRKGFIGRITGVADPVRREYGTAATVAWSVTNGASIVRVHDVEPMMQVIKVTLALLRGQFEPYDRAF